MKNFILIFFLFSTVFLSGQEKPDRWCGTDFNQKMQKQLDDFVRDYYKNNNYERAAGVMKYIPVTLHLVARDDGEGHLTQEKAVLNMCVLNEQFAQANADLYFYIYQMQIVPNTAMSLGDAGDVGLYMNNQSLNIFIVNELPGLCGYYQPGGDFIYLNDACMGEDNSTFAHEMGHMLSLPHTFFGWEYEYEDYECNTQAPVNVGWNETELVDGSNCLDAGDRFCDTPPDFLAYRWNCDNDGFSSNCPHIDANGTPFLADGRFIMSYSDDNCALMNTGFSPDQVAAMHYNIDTERSNLILFNPTWTEISDSIQLLSPINDEQLEYRNWVRFEWAPVAGANRYLLQAKPGDLNNVSHHLDTIVEGTVFEDKQILLRDRIYKWRVQPLNEGFFCAPFSEYETFFTSDVIATNEISHITSFNIFPNPILKGENISISLNSEQEDNVQIQIVDVSGRILIEKNNIRIKHGENNLSMDPDPLSSGLYFIKIQNNNNRILTDKIFIQ